MVVAVRFAKDGRASKHMSWQLSRLDVTGLGCAGGGWMGRKAANFPSDITTFYNFTTSRILNNIVVTFTRLLCKYKLQKNPLRA